MARITYEGISGGCMTDESVCRGLHNATRALRNLCLDMKAEIGRSGADGWFG